MKSTTLQKGNKVVIIEETEPNKFEGRIKGSDVTAIFTRWEDARHWAWINVNEEAQPPCSTR